MASFQYEAIKKSGEVVSGTLEADGQGAVAERLRGMGLMATEIKEAKPASSSFGSFKRKKKVKTKKFQTQKAIYIRLTEK